MVGDGRATRRRRGGDRGRRKFEHCTGRRGCRATARWPVGRRGHAQRRASWWCVVRRGRRTTARRRLVMYVVMRVRKRVDVSQVPADDGPWLVGRLGAGRPPTWLMVVRDRWRLLCSRLLEVIDIAVGIVVIVMVDAGWHGTRPANCTTRTRSNRIATAIGHVNGRLRPGRAQRKVRLRLFGKRRFGRSDLARWIRTPERPHRTAVRWHGYVCYLTVAPASVYVTVSVATAADAVVATGGRHEVTTWGLRTPAAPPPSRSLPIGRGDGARCSTSLLVRYYPPGTDVNF